MVVKSKRGRRRYIAFQVVEGKTISNESLLSALNAVSGPAGLHLPKVIQFDGVKGIVRTSGEEKERWVEAINQLPQRSMANFNIVTLAVSGTLLTLRERFFPNALHRRDR
jgi:RNase P/RNase MRP subunit POP5